mmetsp:Transcript_10824/g.16631  ORF Transcript_10824/g.16631 Transcript_10824/m.16631 type:complete len:252 (-) Transcript_10824:577-1332(-)
MQQQHQQQENAPNDSDTNTTIDVAAEMKSLSPPPLLTRKDLGGKWEEQDGTGRPRAGARRNVKDASSVSNGENDVGIILCGVKSPQNVGSMMRTCRCFGIPQLLHLHYALNDETNVHYWNQPNIVQQLESCSVGLLSSFQSNDDKFQTPFPSMSIADFVTSHLQSNQSPPLVVLEAIAGAVSIHDFKFPQNCHIMVGSEHKGISRQVLKALRRDVDAVIYVPMVGSHHSMNASSAMTVALYEYRKQWPPPK